MDSMDDGIIDVIAESVTHVPDDFMVDGRGELKPRCTAIADSTGKRCGSYVVEGTDKCARHGGKAIAARQKWGQIRENSRSDFKVYWDEHYKNAYNKLKDGDTLDFDELMAMVSTILKWELQNLLNAPEANEKNAENVITLAERLLGMEERRTNIAAKKLYTVTQQNVELMMAAIISIIKRHVKSKDERMEIFNAFRGISETPKLIGSTGRAATEASSELAKQQLIDLPERGSQPDIEIVGDQ